MMFSSNHPHTRHDFVCNGRRQRNARRTCHKLSCEGRRASSFLEGVVVVVVAVVVVMVGVASKRRNSKVTFKR